MASGRCFQPLYIFLAIVLTLLLVIHYEDTVNHLWKNEYISLQGDNIENLSWEYKPQVKVPKEYLSMIHSLEKTVENEKPTDQDMENFVFVTYISSNHFEEAKNMVASVQKNMPGYRIILYDLGLNKEQVQKVNQWCQVDYRVFNFTKYPAYVRNLHTYAFKGLSMQEALQEFPAIHFTDASIRYLCNKEDYLRILFKTAKDTNGVAFGVIGKNLADLMIHPGMFTFLPANITKLHEIRMTGSNHGYLYKNSDTLRRIIEPWVACSLTKDCIAPQGTTHVCTKANMANGSCHRFDQAVLTLLVANNFNYNQTFYNFNRTCIDVDKGGVIPRFDLKLC